MGVVVLVKQPALQIIRKCEEAENGNTQVKLLSQHLIQCSFNYHEQEYKQKQHKQTLRSREVVGINQNLSPASRLCGAVRSCGRLSTVCGGCVVLHTALLFPSGSDLYTTTVSHSEALRPLGIRSHSPLL